MKKLSKDTLVVHGIKTVYTSSMDLVPPIHMTSTFKFKDVECGSNIFKGTEKGFVYSRMGNPTVSLFQEKMAVLEGGEDAVATSSGMSAISAIALTLAGPDDNFITGTTLYGGTYSLFNKHLPHLNIRPRFLTPEEAVQVSTIEAKIDKNTRFLFIETPANPTLDVFDIEVWATAAKNNNIPLVVDNTFATPYLQNPISLGADIVVHSATKYIGGHGDAIGGVIIGSAKTMTQIRQEHTYHFGQAMSPFNAWLFLRGLKTLALRMERHSDNAMKIAHWLESHPKVEKVFYPGLNSYPGKQMAQKQMKKFGGMLAFDLSGGIEAGKKLMDNLKICKLAVSLGDCETLIQHPASMTHASYSAQERQKAGISDGLIRLSVGIENVDDLIQDLTDGLAFT
jgi:methionine-gamma-lyase